MLQGITKRIRGMVLELSRIGKAPKNVQTPENRHNIIPAPAIVLLTLYILWFEDNRALPQKVKPAPDEPVQLLGAIISAQDSRSANN